MLLWGGKTVPQSYSQNPFPPCDPRHGKLYSLYQSGLALKSKLKNLFFFKILAFANQTFFGFYNVYLLWIHLLFSKLKAKQCFILRWVCASPLLSSCYLYHTRSEQWITLPMTGLLLGNLEKLGSHENKTYQLIFQALLHVSLLFKIWDNINAVSSNCCFKCISRHILWNLMWIVWKLC